MARTERTHDSVELSHDAPAFDDLTALLRASTEWTFVEREVEVRLQAGGDGAV